MLRSAPGIISFAYTAGPCVHVPHSIGNAGSTGDDTPFPRISVWSIRAARLLVDDHGTYPVNRVLLQHVHHQGA